MNFTLLVVVLLTAIAFVGIVIALSNAIAPRSYNAQKMEPYECGIPTRGKSWMQFRVGYYLFAILFLMFEVETVFLFPWAVITRELGVAGAELGTASLGFNLSNTLCNLVQLRIAKVKEQLPLFV